MESGKLDKEVATVELKQTRHVLGLSGGKDSAALAIYLKDQDRWYASRPSFSMILGLKVSKAVNG